MQNLQNKKNKKAAKNKLNNPQDKPARQPRKNPIKKKSETFLCNICYEEHSLSNAKSLRKCKHRFCSSCFSQFYESLITDQGKHSSLSCPEYGCETIPTHSEIKDLISPSNFEKYNKFEKNLIVAKDFNLCFCSKPNCEQVLVINGLKTVQCDTCSQITCIKCKSKDHPGKTCDEIINE